MINTLNMNQTVSLKEVQSLLPKLGEGFLTPLGHARDPIAVEGVVKIGRAPSNDVCIEDPFISQHHCQLERRPHGYFIRDLRSTNGTRVNAMRVIEAELMEGTEIQIGSLHFSFQLEKPDSSLNNLPIKTKNAKWRSSIESLSSIANSELPVFLQGQSGTGKEVIAHILHDQSPRGEGPFVSVNCSALTESLVESELFGHVKGSFTGATGDRKGAFEVARGGTLFLDEIGDLPLSLQPKLLRALENQEIRPVGSDRIVKTDVRIVSATHKNLEMLMSQGQFRSDLYFRMNVVKLSIPSLRDRMEDFDDLIYYFCREQRVRFSVAAIEELKKHSWPGNIRELKHTVARAKALFPQKQILPADLTHLVTEPVAVNVMTMSQITPGGQNKFPLLRDMEREVIVSRLVANHGNQRKTAYELGIPKSTLHDRVRLYNIDLKELTRNHV